ncbi:MAG: FKBP-type peptidyl-prolyl cis-trans isomerase [Burkholderiaceae bacterium]|jgi:FKBP-type peptidyl-prolyl cis-trans isomerase SlpA
MSASILVAPGVHLTLHYRLALDSKAAEEATTIVDTFGQRPATFQLGMGQLAPALEAKLIGLRTGDHVSFALAPGEAFGPRNPELVRRISREALDEQAEEGSSYREGDIVEFAAPEGAAPKGNPAFVGVLRQLTEHFALLDFNHPLAGQPVRFEVQIIGVL